MTEYEKAIERAWRDTRVICPYCGEPHCLKDFEDGHPKESSGCDYLKAKEKVKSSD